MIIGISSFARNRHRPGTGKCYFKGEEHELLSGIYGTWDRRSPGHGETDITRKIVVPMDPSRFVGTLHKITPTTALRAVVDRRQEHEEDFISTVAIGTLDQFGLTERRVEALPVKYASVILYSAEALSENNEERSGDFDWEMVAMCASAYEHEPMHPLTMARNMLELPGGTKSSYTADEFAKAIRFWSQHCFIRLDEGGGISHQLEHKRA